MYLIKMFKVRRNTVGDSNGESQTLYTSVAESEEEMRVRQREMESDAKTLANTDKKHIFYLGVYPINKPPIVLRKIHKYFDVVSIDTIIES